MPMERRSNGIPRNAATTETVGLLPESQSARNGLWLTTVDGFTVLIGPNQARRPSQDTRWHVCLGGDDLDPSATETITCVFEPPHS